MEGDPYGGSFFTRADDAAYAALVDRLIAERPAERLSIFGYGSLILNPTFEAAAWRRAVARGWQRQFCIEIRAWRGTPEAPGLMMALLSGGRCAGLPLDVAPGREREVLDDLTSASCLSSRRWAIPAGSRCTRPRGRAGR